MSVESLMSIVSPPSKTLELKSANTWEKVEREMGCLLPLDYKQYIDAYGTGCLGGFIWVFNPFSSNPNLELREQVENRLNAAKAVQPVFGAKFPFKLFPESNGLLPFAATDNGDCICWLTNCEPDSWKIVVVDSREPEWEKFEMNMTDFLTAIFAKTRRCGIFPRRFPSENPTFRAHG